MFSVSTNSVYSNVSLVCIAALAVSGCLEKVETSATAAMVDGAAGSGAAGSPPSITGTPSTSVTVGGNYNFQPTASDPDGDTLTFQIENRPAWANFDASTGRLTGQPGGGDIGMSSNIKISVADQSSTASLNPFGIEVSEQAAGIPPGSGGDPVIPDPPAPVIPAVAKGQSLLLYSDLVRGPFGAFVTIWGQNIPAVPDLTCGNVPCEILAVDIDPNHSAHGGVDARQRVVVRFYEGSGITLGGANTLPYEVAEGRILELQPGPVSLANASAGDVIYLRGGNYNQSSQSCDGSNPIICGRSDVSVISYPGETAVINCSQANAFDAGATDLRNFVLAKIEIDCGATGRAIRASRQGSRSNFRVIGNYVHDARSSSSGAFGEFSATTDLYIVGNRVERTGVAGENNAHAIYHGGRGTSDNVNISYNSLNTHIGGRAIQIFGHQEGELMTNLKIRGNHIVSATGNAGILVSHSDGPSGLAPSDPRRGWIKDALVDFNTIEDGGGSGVSIRNIGVDAVVSNNVVSDGNTTIFVDFAQSVEIRDNCLDGDPRINAGTPAILSGNLVNYPNCVP